MEEVRAEVRLIYWRIRPLKNLVKGGRIGRVTGPSEVHRFNIKVIMELTNHELVPIVKGRGLKTFSKWLDNFVESARNTKNC